VRLAEGYCAKNLQHDRFLLQVGDGVNTIIDLGFLQFVGRNTRWVPTIGVIPRTVGLGG
jgi:hypothetical protein